MTKNKRVYVCRNCGADFSKWQGKCDMCNQWNSLVETNVIVESTTQKKIVSSKPEKISQIVTKKNERINTKISELDRVLGGGLMLGSLVLIGGEPGIGKSTLMLQIADGIKKTLYVSGEESNTQIKIRADRLNLNNKNILLLNETDIDVILKTISENSPELVIIDSIQTIQDSDITSAAGSISQVKVAGLKLQKIAKENKIPIIVTSHVTKEGIVAGPKTLEHLVDCVVYFEGEKYGNFRILRAIKNRFGSINEAGIFEMEKDGLKVVKNPSSMLLENRQLNVPGSAVSCIIEGTRPLLVEIQALSNPTSFGYPKRTSSGISLNKLFLLIAILSNRTSINLANSDVYLNVAGGIKITETAIDLASVVSIASSQKNRITDPDMTILGEVGLSGAVKQVPQIELRIMEAQKLGFKKMIIPKTRLSKKYKIKILQVSTLQQALNLALLK